MDLHQDLLHETLALSSPFLLAVIVAAIATTAVGLICSRRGRLSATSRHLLLSIALLAPPAGALVLSTGVVDLLRPDTVAMPVETVTSFGDVAAVASVAGGRSELACILFGAWLAGIVACLAFSSSQWMRWARVARSATPIGTLTFGTLRLASSPAAAEPMVGGVFRPVVLLPERYTDSLDQAELASVLAHELEHVRRRDNLSAALHELVTAFFWFDPLHWIARRRLLELRERACDEGVLDAGCEPGSYVAALAKTCHAAIESPAIACMSGFHIRERIESIMNYSSNRAQFLPDKFVRVAAVAVALVIVASFAAIAPAPALAANPEMEFGLDVSVRPGPDGRLLVAVKVTAADGEMVLSSQATTTAGQPVTLSASRGGLTYQVEVSPSADGSGIAVLQVTEGRDILYRASETIAAPARKREPRLVPPGYRRLDSTMKRPEPLSRVEPVYTDEARKARISGIVIVEAQIDETGAVRNVSVLKPLPFGLSDSAAEAVRQWVFAPALQDGKPVAVVFNVTVNFKLNEAAKE